jgi:hypothetical protein
VILRERWFLSSGHVCVVDLGKIPDGLNAKETERFLRENSAVVCGHGLGAKPDPGTPAAAMEAAKLPTMELFRVRRNPSQSLGEAATKGFHGFPGPRARRNGENVPHTRDIANDRASVRHAGLEECAC